MNRPPARRGGRDTTQGSILRVLVALAIPIVATNVLQTLYQLIDTFWVGRLGAAAVAAVSLSFPVLFLLIALGVGMTVAGAILVAQYFGAGGEEGVDHAAGQTLLVVFVISAVLTVAGYLLAGPIIGLFRPAADVAGMATAYLQISFLGVIAVFVYYVFQSLLRGVGDVRTPMIVVACTVALNTGLDPLLIMGIGPFPELGVVGAAWATIIAQGLAGAVGLWLLFSGRYGLHLRMRHLKPDPALIRRIVRLGVPSSLDQSMRALGIAVLMVLVARFGTTTIASYGIVSRIFSFVLIPAMGLGMATSTVVGQNVGANANDRAEAAARIGMGAAFGALTTAGVLFFLFATPVVRLFVPDAPAVIADGSHFLRIMALTFGFIGIQVVMGGALAGAGNTLASMALSILSFWVLRLPFAVVLSRFTSLGADGIWWAFPISNVLAAAAAITWFLRGTWIRRIVEDRLVGREPLAEKVREEVIVEEGLE
jgi:putative MATE family efflux protein